MILDARVLSFLGPLIAQLLKARAGLDCACSNCMWSGCAWHFLIPSCMAIFASPAPGWSGGWGSRRNLPDCRWFGRRLNLPFVLGFTVRWPRHSAPPNFTGRGAETR